MWCHIQLKDHTILTEIPDSWYVFSVKKTKTSGNSLEITPSTWNTFIQMLVNTTHYLVHIYSPR